MELEILSLSDALKFRPDKKTYAIRIFDSDYPSPIPNLAESKNWVAIKEYFFNDGWPESWKEYSWVDVDDEYLGGLLNGPWSKISEKYPEMTKEGLISYYESEGHPYERGDLFNKNFAKQILSDFEKVKKNTETILIHCRKGNNRSPAVGIAMNEIFGWEIYGLKERFPHYRRFVHKILMDVVKYPKL